MKKVLFLLAMLPVLVFSACSDDDEKLQDQSVVIKTGEIYTLDCPNVQLQNSNDFIFSLLDGNKIKGEHVGEFETMANSNGTSFKLSVTVEPLHTLYLDLKDFLGMSRENIEKVFGKPLSTNQQGTSVYKGLGIEDKIQIAYDNNKAYLGVVTLKSSFASELGKHLADRYVFFSEQGGQMLYMDALKYEDAEYLAMVTVGLRTTSIMYIGKDDL
jgi:hypothetical protein